MICGAVLGAGEARRFGAVKQLARFAGRPLIEHAIDALDRARGIDRVLVVLGANADEITKAARLEPAEVVIAYDWHTGQAASLRAALRAAGDADAVMVCLADQPLVSEAAIERVISARRAGASIVRASYGGIGGHPVLIERDLFDRLGELDGDVGARALQDETEWLAVACDGLGRPDDIDTPEQLEGLSV